MICTRSSDAAAMFVDGSSMQPVIQSQILLMHLSPASGMLPGAMSALVLSVCDALLLA